MKDPRQTVPLCKVEEQVVDLTQSTSLSTSRQRTFRLHHLHHLHHHCCRRHNMCKEQPTQEEFPELPEEEADL